MIIFGNPAAEGIALAKCLVIKEIALKDYTSERIGKDYIEEEQKKFFSCKEAVIEKLKGMVDMKLENSSSIKNDVMAVHLALIKDPMLSDSISEKIKNDKLSALGAVQKVIEEFSQSFEATGDNFFCERVLDLRDIGRRLINQLNNISGVDLSNLKEDVILSSREILPSQLADANTIRVKGIITEIGGTTSHTVIIAKNLGIPVVTGIKGITDILIENEMVAVNGTEGTIELKFDEKRKNEITKVIKKNMQEKKLLNTLINKQTITRDGVTIKLFANIIDNEGAIQAIKMKTEGIGLFRTEFLFMDRIEVPSEEEQFQTYKDILQTMEGRTVTIRTLDIGGDKESVCLKLPKENNPFLGYRAIRICLNEKILFKTQLRAILRASAYGSARIMYPMISAYEEVIEANAILNEAKKELIDEGIAIDNNISVGIMIETPAAAVIADILINEVDFFSIGTNDLTQYLLAVDRMNEKISKLYNFFHPGVLKIIAKVIEDVKKAGKNKTVCMCGEMAGDPAAALLLIGMGLREFSMNPSSILKIRQIINTINLTEARLFASIALKMASAEEIEKMAKLKYSETIF